MGLAVTGRELVDRVRLRAGLSKADALFSNDDILELANAELASNVLPTILELHEEFYVKSVDVEVVANQDRYPIPERAYGGKLRDLQFVDTNTNIYEMTCVSRDDIYYRNFALITSPYVYYYYVEGNDIILFPKPQNNVNGLLKFTYYQRPNYIVDIDEGVRITTINKRSATITDIPTGSGTLTVTASSHGFSNGDYVFLRDVNSTPALSGQFIISGVTMNTFDITTSDTVTVAATSGTAQIGKISVATNTSIFPANLMTGLLDLNQTRSPHRILATSLTPGLVDSSTKIVFFNPEDLPTNLAVGDYVCSEQQTVIPNLPTELHTKLVQATVVKCLEGMRDTEGFQNASAKLAEMNENTQIILNNRTESSPKKIVNRNGFLRRGKPRIIR